MYTKTSLKNQFDKEGFIILENIFTSAEVNQFENVIRKTIAILIEKAKQNYPHIRDIKTNDEFDSGIKALMAINPQFISFIQRTISRSPEFFYLSSKTSHCQLCQRIIRSR